MGDESLLLVHTFFYFGKLPYICFLKISKWVAQANVLSIQYMYQ